MSRKDSPQLRTVGQVERLYAGAMADYARGCYKPAAKALLGLILIDPSQARFFKGMAACLQLSGNYQQAAMAYASAYSLKADDPTVLLYLAQCFAGVKGWKEAGEAAQTFLDETKDCEAYGELRSQAMQVVHTAEFNMNSQRRDQYDHDQQR